MENKHFPTGNIGNVNLNGNTFTYLNGAGNWANIAVPVVGNIAPLNLNGNGATVLAGNGAWVPATSGGNIAQLNLNGNANTVLSGTGSWRAIGNVSAANYNGNSSTYLNGAGQWANIPVGVTGAAGSNTWIQYNAGGAFGANSFFTYDIPSSTMKAVKVSADGLMNVHYATESVSINSFAPAGTYNLDAISNSIHYTISISGNIALNIRGNASTTINNILSIGNSITVTYLMTTGGAGNVVNTVSVDGGTIIPKWAGNVAPVAIANAVSSYTFTIIKISNSPTYTVLASAIGYV